MEKKYEIPPGGDSLLSIGKWVEIFEAYGDADSQDAIRVRSMRIGGRKMVFGGRKKKMFAGQALRPHEGEVVSIDRGQSRTRFGLRLRS